MKKFFKRLGAVVVSLLLFAQVTYALGLNSNLSIQTFWRFLNNAIEPINTAYDWGSTTRPWDEGHFNSLFTGTIAISSAVSGDLDLNGNSLIWDADADTYSKAATDDQLAHYIGSGGAVTWLYNSVVGATMDVALVDLTQNLHVDGWTEVDATMDVDLLATFNGGVDMNGTKIDLDADADTSITADTNNQIDIEIAGADDFVFTANDFEALAGSSISHADNVLSKFGSGDDYWDTYNSTSTQFEMWSTDIDGIGADGVVFSINDGTDDVNFTGGITSEGFILTDGMISFVAADPITSTSYQIGRSSIVSPDALIMNVPTGRAIQFYVNGSIVTSFDVDRMNLAELGQISSAANSLVTLATTGMTLHRNVADANTNVIIKQDHASSTGAILEVKNDLATTLTIAQDGGLTLAPEAQTSGAPDTFTITGAAHTGITAATEDVGLYFNLAATKTWAAGAGPLASQREIRIAAPTYNGTAGGALTITDAATVYISGAPIQGTNMTLSNTHALWVDAGNVRFDGTLNATGGGALTGTWSDLGIVTTVDVNGGTIDGTSIGLSVASTGGFTALVATSLDLNGALDLDVAALGATITNTADAASSQVMILEGDRVTMVDNDEAYLTFRLSNDGGAQKEFGRFTWVGTDVNAATDEDGRLDFAVVTAGALADELQLDGAALAPSVDAGLTLGTTTLGFSMLHLSSSGATQIDLLAQDQGAGNNTAGRPLLLAAGSAGSLTTGAGGGALFLEGGNAGGSGNNNGANINLTAGTATGSGQAGVVNIHQPGGTPGTDTLGLTHNGTDAVFANLSAGGDFSFVNSSFGAIFTIDTADGKVTMTGPVVENGTTTSLGAGAVGITGRIHEITTTGIGNALTLADGTEGQRITIVYVQEAAGTDTAILTPTSMGNGTTVTFNAVGDMAEAIFTNGKWYIFTEGAIRA